MTITTLRGGCEPETATALPAERLCCAGASVDHAQIARLACEAASNPLGLPSLRQCLTPDDHVALAVAPGAPAASAVVAGVVSALAEAGIERRRIRVVAAEAREARSLEEALADEVAAGVAIESHDPLNEDGLCFAGVTRSEQPLLLNRTLFEADVVLPIAGVEPDDDAEASAAEAHRGIYPEFFDRTAIDRYYGDLEAPDDEAPAADAPSASRARDAHDAAGIVAASLVLRAVPGPDGGVTAVVAGLPLDVGRSAREAGRAAWVTPLAEPADLVLAVVSGGPEQQTWDAVARALAVAEPLTKPGGAVAVWSDVAEPIDSLVERLEQDAHAVDRFGDSDPQEQDFVAQRFAEALDRGPVFLHSRIDPDDVETLGFAPVADEAEMQRLVGRFEACTVVEGAQHVRFQLEDGAEA